MNTKDLPLVMTAAIDPRGMSNLSVNDVKEREQQYLSTLKFYLEKRLFSQIVFIENSNYPLDNFKPLQEQFPQTTLEFISIDKNDYPRQLGKSYGEMLILDYIVDNSNLVKKSGAFIKVTGRFPILNIDKLLKEAQRRQPWTFFCDCKDHKVYDWLHLGWNGHACDTRFFIVTLDFYRKYFYNRYHELDDSQQRLIETMFFQTAKDLAGKEQIIRRFKTEPEYAGKAGHVQISIIGVNNYSGLVAKTKRRIRQVCRKIIPFFWF